MIHPLLMRAHDEDGDRVEFHAFNEVSLFRQTYQAARLRILIDGEERLPELVADGVLLATPAGSTAYNLSAQGPIIPINAPLMALTPISPFRPRRWRGALLPDTARVRVDVLEPEKRPVAAVADHDEVRAVLLGRHPDGSQHLDADAVRSRPQPRRAHPARAVRVLNRTPAAGSVHRLREITRPFVPARHAHQQRACRRRRPPRRGSTRPCRPPISWRPRGWDPAGLRCAWSRADGLRNKG